MKTESTGIHPACYSCVISQACSAAKQAGLNREETQDILDTVARQLLIARFQPMLVQHIVRKTADTIQGILRKPDFDIYAEIKKRSHQIASSFVPGFQAGIENSPTPLETALRITAAGNIIDFGAKNHGSLDVRKELSQVDDLRFGHYDFLPFQESLGHAKHLLYLCDNVGELDFDKLLMQEIHKEFPEIHITAALRESPIINDATLEDAREAGIDQVATLISSGSVYPGTILPECNVEFQELFQHSDVMISKGQGNFETLLPHADVRIFFLLRIKCDTMAQLAGQRNGDLVFLQGNHLAPLKPS
ncbi:MAG TPA: ARMT1-like domain-containing protein [Fibrobacteraceae bacterium]|nr:ARMT1-like domain-containing protein [Fibrobacteraceae bacterium]